jgi:hypothetical protein
MRPFVLRTVFIAGIFTATVFIFNSICYFNRETVAFDGAATELLATIFKSDTDYSKGYSHSKFNTIKIGMTEKEVLSALGEPLVIWSPYEYGIHVNTKKHYVGYCYSKAGTSSDNYRFRQINFDHGIVVEINRSFYLD